MLEKVYVVMRDCDYEGDEIYDNKFYLSKEVAEKLADSLITRDLNGHIIQYYWVAELDKGAE